MSVRSSTGSGVEYSLRSVPLPPRDRSLSSKESGVPSHPLKCRMLWGQLCFAILLEGVVLQWAGCNVVCGVVWRGVAMG